MREQMKSISNLKLIVIFAALILASAASILIMTERRQDALIAEIYSEGKLLYTIDLNKVTESYTIELPHNTVLVEHGQISMKCADCPDQVCVRQGKIKNGAYPIVCLPNRVEIRITNKAGVDAVTGR